MNLTGRVSGKMGINLHNKLHHPLSIIKNRIYQNFPTSCKFDDLDPVVPIQENFDRLLIPDDHPSRRESDTYYVDEHYCLRTHTSAHQVDLLSKGYTDFVVTGDCYRKDTIDRCHYPVFHQMEVVRICSNPSIQLEAAVLNLIRDLFPKCEYRRVDSYFPFTHPSWEYEIKWEGAWMEVLGCGMIHHRVIEDCGLTGETGWAFGLGLDRLAMVLFDIPDIRLLWSEDERFLTQFREGQATKFVPFSRHPPCYKDVSFWLPNGFNFNNFCELVRDTGGDLVEEIKEVDTYRKEDRLSKCYRINYRSIGKTLTNEEVDEVQELIRQAITIELKAELR